MADDPTDPDPKDPDPKAGDTLGDAGKKALEQERKARRDAEQRTKDLEQRLKDIEDKDKTDTDKLREENDQLRKDLTDATSRADRYEVALDKGLSKTHAKRLSGATREELESDADELLEAFPTSTGSTPPSSRPRASLRGGGDPTEEPEVTDPAKLAASVPRI